MQIRGVFTRLSRISQTAEVVKDDNPKPFSEEEMIEEAHQALVQAQNLFSRVEDPDMIDYAIYTMKAAEERFDFLVKSIKLKNQNEVQSAI